MSDQEPKQSSNPYIQGMLLGPEVTGVIGQVAFMSVFIIGAGLGAGILLDRMLDSKPMFTLVGILISLPLHMWLVYKIAMRAVNQVAERTQKNQNQTNQNSDQEDTLSE